MALAPSRGDSDVVLLKKILLALGCPGVDCCGFQTEQNLLFLWAQCACDGCLNPVPPIPPIPPESNLWLLENGDFYQLEDGSGGYLLE